MREVELFDVTGDDGHISFRVTLPPQPAKAWELAATDTPSRAFWSTGYAFGSASQELGEDGIALTITVVGGELTVRSVELTGLGSQVFDTTFVLSSGDGFTATI